MGAPASRNSSTTPSRLPLAAWWSAYAPSFPAPPHVRPGSQEEPRHGRRHGGRSLGGQHQGFGEGTQPGGRPRHPENKPNGMPDGVGHRGGARRGGLAHQHPRATAHKGVTVRRTACPAAWDTAGGREEGTCSPSSSCFGTQGRGLGHRGCSLRRGGQKMRVELETES
jgi:hypothetical protein